MAYAQVQLGLRSNVQRDTAAGSAKLLNCYADDAGVDAKVRNPVYACDGWSSFSTLTSGGVTRGMINLDDTLLWVMSGGNLYSVTTGGTAPNRAAVATSGYAYFARNRAATPDIAMVTSDGLTRLISGTTITTPTYAGGVDQALFNSVCQRDGYFVFTKSDGEFYASGIDATTIDELDFAKASTYADGLTRGVVRGRDLVLMGPRSTEFWQDVGNTDFPFQRVHVTAIGAYAAPAVVPLVGVTDGVTSDTVIWPASGPDGSFIGVMMMGGYDAKKISTHEIDSAIRAATKANLRAYSYASQGVTFYCITDAATFTYEFNCKTGFWHQRKGSSLSFSRIVDACEFNGATIFGDYTSALIYQRSASQTPASASELQLRTSRDNGTTWSSARTKAIGGSSARKTRQKFAWLGQSGEDGLQVELTITNSIVEGSNAVSMTVIPPTLHGWPNRLTYDTLHVDCLPGVSLTAAPKGLLQIGVDTRIDAA